MVLRFFLFAIAYLFMSCSDVERDNPYDSDGINYQGFASYNCNRNGGTVKIGGQIWMAENLNCNVSGSRCYNNDPVNCVKYGRLYPWVVAKNVCPSGWHLPSKAEWDALTTYIESDKDCTYCVGKHLKATVGWNENGLDSYGFAAMPGGMAYSYTYSPDDDAGELGLWWSTTEYDGQYGTKTYFKNLCFSDDEGCKSISGTTGLLLSVRCLQD